jgi:hypothetical protein
MQAYALAEQKKTESIELYLKNVPGHTSNGGCLD